MPANIQKNKLFVASCMALLVTSLSFGIRAGLLDTWKHNFVLSQEDVSIITSTAFWGFPLAIIVGGFVVDIIGMKKLLVAAALFHLIGIVLTIYATGFWSLFISTLLIGIGNGTVEAACNPLVASLYTERKTVKLNHFHLWFPGGIVIGTLIVRFMGVNIDTTSYLANWKMLVAIMLIPTVIYGYLFSKLEFPPTERVSSGISSSEMYKALINPLFFVMIILMFGTAITELFTGQWIDVLLHNVTENALLLLTLETGIMVLGRAFAGPVVGKLSPTGVLILSATFASIGLYILGHTTGNMLFAGALIFGVGVCYFWPTMIGFVSENLPRTGAVGMNLMGGAGMFAVSIYMIFMGGYYDRLEAAQLPAGGTVKDYSDISATPEMVNALNEAKKLAGPQIINVTMIIPIVLTAAFIGLFFYVRSRKKEVLHPVNVAATAESLLV